MAPAAAEAMGTRGLASGRRAAHARLVRVRVRVRARVRARVRLEAQPLAALLRCEELLRQPLVVAPQRHQRRDLVARLLGARGEGLRLGLALGLGLGLGLGPGPGLGLGIELGLE